MTFLRASAAAAVFAAVTASAATPSAPVAQYWMDVTTSSGFGAGMGAGSRPSVDQVMAMMSGGGGAVGHSLDLRLASRTPAPRAPRADHYVPAALNMGASLPLVVPPRESASVGEATPNTPMARPQGRMLLYWGCGEHAAAGQPRIIDFAKVAAGKVPPEWAAMRGAAHAVQGPNSAPGFGRWPNARDPRSVPPSSSLVGAHRIAANYAPEIGFALNQDFMPGVNFAEAGNLPSGAARLRWTPAAPATGFALAMYGSNAAGDVVMWSSGTSPAMPVMDYLAPAEVRRLVSAGAVLSPATGECVMPAEVASASPMGMVQLIAYGPEANFSDSPKAPKWIAKVRYKSTASVMRGMQGAMGGAMGQNDRQQPPPPPRKKRGFGLGDLLGAIPVPH